MSNLVRRDTTSGNTTKSFLRSTLLGCRTYEFLWRICSSEAHCGTQDHNKIHDSGLLIHMIDFSSLTPEEKRIRKHSDCILDIHTAYGSVEASTKARVSIKQLVISLWVRLVECSSCTNPSRKESKINPKVPPLGTTMSKVKKRTQMMECLPWHPIRRELTLERKIIIGSHRKVTHDVFTHSPRETQLRSVPNCQVHPSMV